MSVSLRQQNTEFQARRREPTGTHDRGLLREEPGCGESRMSGSEVAVGEATPSPTITEREVEITNIVRQSLNIAQCNNGHK